MIKGKVAGQAAPQGVGLGMDSFTEGGGLFDDFDGTIVDARFTQWDYDGKVDPPVLALCLEIMNDEVAASDGQNPEQPQQNPFLQYYSAGNLTDFVPSDDGLQAVPVGSKTGINKGTNCFLLIASAIAAGVTFTNSLIALHGVKAHFKREAQPERKGLKKDDDGRKREVLKIEKLITGAAGPKPGPKAGPGPKPVAAAAKPGPGPKPVAAGPKPTTPAPAAHAATNGVPDEATQILAGMYITEKLTEAGGSHPKTGLAQGVIGWAAKNQDPSTGAAITPAARNKVIQACGNEAFLSMEGTGWIFDGETLALATE